MAKEWGKQLYIIIVSLLTILHKVYGQTTQVSWSFMLPLIGPHSSVKSGLEIPYEDTCC